MTTITNMGIIRHSYNGLDRINYRADARQFTHKTKKIITHVNCKTMQKNNTMLFFSVNLAVP